MTSGAGRSKAILEVTLRIDGGERRDDAIAFLCERGVPVLEASRIVDRMIAANRADNRTKGLVRLGASLVCLAISLPLLLSVFVAGQGSFLRLGFGRASAFAGLILGAGLWLAWRGVVLFTRGHVVRDEA